MTRVRGACILALALVVPGACAGPESGSRETRPTAQGRLGDGVVAQVGPLAVRGEDVGRIAAAQGVDLPAARERAIYDALWAVAASRDPDPVADTAAVRAAVRGVLAGELLHGLWEQARSEPVRDDELARWTERRWIDVDRPEGFRTVHAVAMVGESADAAAQQRARALAERWRDAAADAVRIAQREPAPQRSSEDRFRAQARTSPDPAATAFIRDLRAVPVGGLQVQIATLPVVAEDGRLIDLDASPATRLVPEFCQAVAAMKNRGDLSPVVHTPFGYHVILLLERIEARHPSVAQRRIELAPSIWKERAQQQRQQLLTALRDRSRVDIVTNVDALLGLATIEP